MTKDERWDVIIEPKVSLWKLNLKEVWRYKDLLFMMVKRDFVTFYKQTILGPLWFIIQPLFTSITFTLIFSRLAGVSTNGQPDFLFYMAGVTIWNYFSDCLNKTATTFKDNQNIFGKVYFPRIVSPLSIVISNLIKFSIQYCVFLGFLFIGLLNGSDVSPNYYILLTPIYILLMGCLSLGLGMIISSLTTKYRDLYFLIQFGVQLLMYGSSVVIPISTLSDKHQTIKQILQLNPLVSIIENFRNAYIGGNTVDLQGLIYSAVASFLVLLIGIIIFNKTEKNFMDTV